MDFAFWPDNWAQLDHIKLSLGKTRLSLADLPALLALVREQVAGGLAKGMVLGVIKPDGTRTIVAYGDPGEIARHRARLIELGTERVTASQVLDVVDREPVRRRFGLDDDDVARSFLTYFESLWKSGKT